MTRNCAYFELNPGHDRHDGEWLACPRRATVWEEWYGLDGRTRVVFHCEYHATDPDDVPMSDVLVHALP